MLAESWNNGMNTRGYYRRCCGKHVSMATDINATVEDAVFSLWPVLLLHKKDQLDKPVSQWLMLNCIISQCYPATNSEQTEGFIYAVVVVIYRVHKSVRLL